MAALVVPDSPAFAAKQEKAEVVTARQHPDLQKFHELARIAGLKSTLAGKRRLTAFAPSNGAFAKLPAATLDKLSRPGNKALLSAVLRHHLVAGNYSWSRLKRAKIAVYELPASDGSRLKMDVRSEVSVGDATVIQRDLKAANGVVHIINEVMIPNHVKARLASMPEIMAPKAKVASKKSNRS
ncbi:MAG: fasciclin domain-containing protein [Hyphomicrobiaceae bacterium]